MENDMTLKGVLKPSIAGSESLRSTPGLEYLHGTQRVHTAETKLPTFLAYARLGTAVKRASQDGRTSSSSFTGHDEEEPSNLRMVAVPSSEHVGVRSR